MNFYGILVVGLAGMELFMGLTDLVVVDEIATVLIIPVAAAVVTNFPDIMGDLAS